MQEIAGFNDGAAVAKTKIAGGLLMGRAITLANLPGDVKDIVYVLADEKLQGKENLEELAREMRLPQNMSVADFVVSLDWPKAQCSMMAVWGSRTTDSELLSGRNLDWNQNTGINKFKMVSECIQLFFSLSLSIHLFLFLFSFRSQYGILQRLDGMPMRLLVSPGQQWGHSRVQRICVCCMGHTE